MKPPAAPLRIGAVSYLNAQPLVANLPALAPTAEIVIDLPSRLADGLAAGRLDVALIPSIEYFRQPRCTIVSDACIACRGPVRSVRLYGRRPAAELQTVALDEGSRTSAALARILLKERLGLDPAFQRLPLGLPLESVAADAALVIGDRGIAGAGGDYAFVWDLGEEWYGWTGLSFVFAMWVARPGIELDGLDTLLSVARNDGVGQLEAIAARESPRVGISAEDCLAWFRHNLRFRFDDSARAGLLRFYQLARTHGLAPEGVELVFHGAGTR